MGQANNRGTFEERRMQAMMNQQQQIQVDISKGVKQSCKICSCPIFEMGIQLYIISALVSPNGQELLAQQPVMVCKNCGAPYGTAKEELTNDQ